MSLASIMVYVDFDETAEERIRAAVDLASRFHSLLIGVGAWPLLKSEPSAPALETASPAADEHRQQAIVQRLERLGEQFRQAVGASPCGVEWRSSPHFPREVLVEQSRAADLLVIGQGFIPGDNYHTYDPGSVILGAGRPVLVVPRGVKRIDFSKMMIAWKDTREACRAVRDALPFLKKARKVAIGVANSQPGSPSISEQVGDLTRYLARHGVPLDQDMETVAGEDDGSILLDLAEDYGAPLIVAGAYGRTRLSEWIFGGVTRRLLTANTIPCLFSS
jgi:nucleotide-binding universal stress UspA family protein